MSIAATNAPPLTAAGHARALLSLGLPLVGSHLAQIGLHVTDTVMVGWYGVTELAGVVLGTSSFFILFILGAGFANAVMPLVAAAAARGEDQALRRATRMGMWLSIAYGIAVYPVFFFGEPILLWLGQAPDVARLAGDYMAVAGLGMVPALLIMTLKSHLAGLSRTQVVLWVTIAGVFVNAAINWALIFGRWGAPELGVTGAAIASVFTQAASFLVLAVYSSAAEGLSRFHLWQRFWRLDREALSRVFRLGWPIGLTGLAEGGMFEATAIMMGWIGPVQLAAHGIALEVTAITFMVHLGLSNAATVRTGQAFGNGDVPGLAAGARVAVLMSLAFAAVTVAVFLAVPREIIGLFTDLSKPEAGEILAFGAVLLACAALFQVADGMQVMGLGLLRGVQDTRAPMAMAIFAYWVVGIPAAYVMAFLLGLGGAGLWLGLVTGLSVSGSLLMWRFWSRTARLRAG